MLASIGNFFTSLLGKFSALAVWFAKVFAQLFIDLWNMATDAVCWVFEGALSIASGALDAISIPFDPQTYYSLIPAETGQVLGAIGITQSLSIIVSALLIRFALQTIPFVRWGS